MRQHEEPNQIRPGMTIREEHYRGRHQLERPHNYHRRDVFIMAVIVNGKKVAGLGQPGKDGAPGKSAYQAAKEKGYTGTEEEFNTALAGMQSAPFLPLAGGTMKSGATIQGTDSLSIISPQQIQIATGSTAIRITGNTIVLGGDSANTSFFGTLNMSGYPIKSVPSPVDSTDAANKQYVDEHAGARVVTGSYVGTGDYNSGTGWGSSNPTSLTFDFAPKLLIIGWQETLDSGFFTSNLGERVTSDNYYSIYTGALTTQFKQYRGFGDPSGSYAKKSSDGKTITWYATGHANAQRNDRRCKYYYLAIG